MESFTQDYRVGQNDLVFNIYARSYSAQPGVTFPCTPFWVRYDVGFIQPSTGLFVPIGSRNRLPQVIATGKVTPNFIIEGDWETGIYEIRWYCKTSETSLVQMTSVQFSVTSDGVHQSKQTMENHSDISASMILS